MKLTALEICAGEGVASPGLEAAGSSRVMLLDNDPHALAPLCASIGPPGAGLILYPAGYHARRAADRGASQTACRVNREGVSDATLPNVD